jgi:cysteine synthase B
MTSNLSQERRDAMAAYGAELILESEEKGMEGARDLADKMEKDGKGKQLDQFSNVDNSGAHINTTAEEIWQDIEGKIKHFVSYPLIAATIAKAMPVLPLVASISVSPVLISPRISA